MTRQMFALSLGFAALILVTRHAEAAPTCAPRPQVVAQLATRFGETRQNLGIAANNTVMEMFASTATGSWTITITRPDGLTCLVASGQAWEAVDEELPAKGDPA